MNLSGFDHNDRQALLAILANTEKIMSGVSDLTAAIASIAADLTEEGTEIQEVIAALQNGGLTDAQAEALAVQLQGSATVITNATASLQNALNPPAAPAKP